MKKFLVLLMTSILAVCLIAGLAGCGAGIAGTYVNQDGSGDYLELRNDGTYYLEEEGLKITGDWEAEGNELSLSWMGFWVTCTIDGNDIVDGEGEVWVKG